jgi:hypothetical protein
LTFAIASSGNRYAEATGVEVGCKPGTDTALSDGMSMIVVRLTT